MTPWRVPLSDLDFGAEETEAVNAVIESGWLTMGEVTQKFEREFANLVRTQHAVAVTNGTAALHLACLAAGFRPGDEVIVPSLTFVATANAVRYVGAVPVFADIGGEDDLNISPEAIRDCITDRTRGIIVMHYAGYLCDMPAIQSIAADHGLVIIEDAAHAPGGSLNGRMAGAWGVMGCFSFFPNKNLTTGEGGMVVTDDPLLAENVRNLRSHGMTTLTLDRHKGHAFSYDVTQLGYNYRIDEVRSAIGRVQLQKLETNNARRRRLTGLYREVFAEIAPEIRIPFSSHKGESSCHILPALLPVSMDRQKLMAGMKEQGIQTSVHYPPIHKFQAYRNKNEIQEYNLYQTETVAQREVTLPLFPTLREDQVVEVAQAASNALRLSGVK